VSACKNLSPPLPMGLVSIVVVTVAVFVALFVMRFLKNYPNFLWHLEHFEVQVEL
jgi:hypothetical protein